MCGIFAYIGKRNNASEIVLEGLKKLEYRGYDSWGIAIIPTALSTIRIEKHIGRIGTARTTLSGGTVGIGHTRWATHGGVTDINAHPHLDCTKKIAVVHNGIVENYQDLKDDLKKAGHEFISETDTEVIAHLVEEKSKNTSFIEAVFKTFKSLVGSNAIVVLDSNTETIAACRNGSPLVVGIGQNNYFLASDAPPFLKYTNKVHFLHDGEGACLSKKGVDIYDIKSEEKKEWLTQTLDWKTEDAGRGGYPHFLLKEIMEQKNTITKTALINEEEIKKIASKIKKSRRVVLTACGTASYCALAAKYFFSQRGRETQMYGAYEFLPFAKFCDKKTTLIAISQSGETADTLIAAKAAKEQGAYIVAVINARGSTLERLADAILPVGAGPEIAVVSTKAFTSQLATTYLLSQATVGRYMEAKKDIQRLGKAINNWLEERLLVKIINLAKLLVNKEHIYLIGKYLNYPAVLEFALKIKETSYLHAEPFAAGELKHGVITLIRKGTPCFVLINNDEVRQEVLSSAAELKARLGYIIGVGPLKATGFDSFIQTPDVGDLTIFPNIIVGQLLGYYLGIGRGADPDRPRNLAKSVTVK